MAKSPKTAAKTATKRTKRRPKLKPQPHGGALLTGGQPGNSGGKKGRSGPRPNEWKEWCRLALQDEGVRDAIVEALRDRATRGYGSLLRVITDHGVGLPDAQPLTDEERKRRIKELLGLDDA